MRPLRNPVVQALAARLLSGWMKLCFATMRWRHENLDQAEQVWREGGGVIVAFWHSRIALSPAAWPLDRAQPARALISLSPDGQFIARAVARLGFPAIHGSTAKKEAPERAKGGSRALREGLRQLRIGALAVTPDGPRGPDRSMGEGVPLMARMSGRPVLLLGLASSPAIRLSSWDRALIPLPFSKGAVVWELHHYPEDTATGEVAAQWKAALDRVTERAEALVGS
ncbi:MAG: lysophospholipid acyltransferase family protein [Brevundimonas sp.]|jgi:lysophospholipid acyltransferase (LPLAT)-like uncharacterized protein|uniref:lysophospholipid acyltransferase family protein n=1 Tax=Brevundimonas sp. TaxID=1871086 RepID=UPI00391BAFB3